jgi:predicted nucleic acid-binding protein
MNYMLDTCIVSELVKRQPSPVVVGWLSSIPVRDLFISAITLGEIQKGISRLAPNDHRLPPLEAWLAEIQHDYSGRIVAFDESAAILWGRIAGENSRKGRTLPVADSQIAATALASGMTLVTRNVSDMAGMGVPIFNPFSD